MKNAPNFWDLKNIFLSSLFFGNKKYLGIDTVRNNQY
jgi:hypothetical protein